MLTPATHYSPPDDTRYNTAIVILLQVGEGEQKNINIKWGSHEVLRFREGILDYYNFTEELDLE